MSENPFAGASRDPIALLEQLLSQVAGLKREFGQMQQDLSEVKQDLTEVKQDLSEVKQDLTEVKQDLSEVKHDLAQTKQEFGTRFDTLQAQMATTRTDIAGMRSEMVRFATNVDQDHAAYKVQVENAVERKVWLTGQRFREAWQEKYADLELRVAQLEEAERRRQEGKGA